MILYTNGCSWTWGGALEPWFETRPQFHDNDLRLSLVWPHHLGKLLEADKVVNLSEGCGSNQRILRTTLDWLLRTPKSDLEQTVAVIQFTELTRFELYEVFDESNPYKNIDTNWISCKVDHIQGRFPMGNARFHQNPKYNRLKERVNERIADTSELELMYVTLSYVHAIHDMFRMHGVKDVYIWHHGNHWGKFWPEQYKSYLYSNFKVLQQDTIWDYDRMYGIRHEHPSVEGHKELAKLLFDDMISKGYVR